MRKIKYIFKDCPMCGNSYKIKVDEEQFIDYTLRGKPIQDAFPELNPMEREFIKSGYCKDCQNMLFGTDYKSRKITGAY